MRVGLTSTHEPFKSREFSPAGSRKASNSKHANNLTHHYWLEDGRSYRAKNANGFSKLRADSHQGNRNLSSTIIKN